MGAHLERVAERAITLDDLQRLRTWVVTDPWAPDGDWYKDFGSFILCGTGEYPKTVLKKGMKPFWNSAMNEICTGGRRGPRSTR
jgi:hypothetical protein